MKKGEQVTKTKPVPPTIEDIESDYELFRRLGVKEENLAKMDMAKAVMDTYLKRIKETGNLVSTDQIAKILHVSAGTIKKHCEAFVEKGMMLVKINPTNGKNCYVPAIKPDDKGTYTYGY